MKTGRYSLGQLLNNDDIDQIVIPELQRDYVWTPQNVTALLQSIGSNYARKEKLDLTIMDADKAVDQRSKQFLTKEYERLRYNTRIGFIYAYYDASDNRRFYLIDGQQRITTLFLLLLAACVRQGEAGIEHFRKTYFKDNRPHLDYRVREGAHNCLVGFIDYALTETGRTSAAPGRDFKSLSPKYYHEYDNDPTACALLANYDVITQWLAEHYADRDDIVDYVENFIEFNYFDTGLSQQGERLYLYMNSRGEELSSQEQIRPILIKRCGENGKLEAGRLWEEWQNFFWTHRGENENADNGFFGFLKIAVILHQALSEALDEVTPRLKTAVQKTDGRKQTQTEVREEYIQEQLTDKQREWIPKYISENDRFNIRWLEKVFRAYRRLSDLYDRSGQKEDLPHHFLREAKWRALSSMSTIHYVPLCGTLTLAILHEDVNDEDLYRLAMYLLSRSDNDNNSKVPDTATRRAMSLAIAMNGHGITDVRLLTDAVTRDQNILRPDDLEFACYRQGDADEWERFFWELTADEALNRFLNGNRDIILRLSTTTEGGPYTLNEARESLHRFKDKIYLPAKKNRKDRKQYDNLLRELLRHGDISSAVESYPWVTDRNMQRYDLPHSDSNWQLLFADKKYLPILKDYTDDATPHTLTPTDTWRMGICGGLDYMEYHRFLRYDEAGQIYPHIVLLKKAQARSNLTRSLPAYLLHTQLEGSWLPGDDSRCCALDFCICEGKFEIAKANEGGYCLGFVHIWDAKRPHWEVYMGRRGEAPFSEAQTKRLCDTGDWCPDDDIAKRQAFGKFQFKAVDLFVDTTGYDEEGLIPSIRKLTSFVKELKESLPHLLTE